MSVPIIPVILCGGSGTRLWPASRDDRPKQFLNLVDKDFSLLQNTLRRALRISGAAPGQVVTITLESLREDVVSHLSAIDPEAALHVVGEPAARDTAAAVALAALYVTRHFGAAALMWVLPADHHISDENALRPAFAAAREGAIAGRLVTFGMKPTRPETGYGYIRAAAGTVLNMLTPVEQFVEKPDVAMAQSYCDQGCYLWNSGMFVFTAGTVIDQYRAWAPALLAGVQKAMVDEILCEETYAALERQPFDKAIMEKTDAAAVVPAAIGWSDIGSWQSLWELQKRDHNGNAARGHVALHDSRDCLVQGSESKFIAVAGLTDVVIIDTDDTILIADRSNTEALRVLANGLKREGIREALRASAMPAVVADKKAAQ